MTSAHSSESLSLDEQVFAVGLATTFSLLYGVGVIWYTTGQLSTIPSEFYVTCFFTVVFAMVVSREDVSKLIDRFTPIKISASDQLLSAVKYAGVVMVSVLCIVLLGWFAGITGGTLASPFAISLLAMALLCPYVANTMKTTMIISLLVVGVFIIFRHSYTPTVFKFSDGVLIATPIINVIITLALEAARSKKPSDDTDPVAD